jgi:hypothetical protein
MKTYSPSQAAIKLGVSQAAVQKWVTEGKIAHFREAAGMLPRIKITEQAIQDKLAERESQKRRLDESQDPEAWAWIRLHRKLFSVNPVRFSQFCAGKITLEDMKNDIRSARDQLF